MTWLNNDQAGIVCLWDTARFNDVFMLDRSGRLAQTIFEIRHTSLPSPRKADMKSQVAAWKAGKKEPLTDRIWGQKAFHTMDFIPHEMRTDVESPLLGGPALHQCIVGRFYAEGFNFEEETSPGVLHFNTGLTRPFIGPTWQHKLRLDRRWQDHGKNEWITDLLGRLININGKPVKFSTICKGEHIKPRHQHKLCKTHRWDPAAEDYKNKMYMWLRPALNLNTRTQFRNAYYDGIGAE
eukprot:gene3065-2129_t